jgi:hypothetical protein
MISAHYLIRFLDALPSEAQVAIDGGGLTLLALNGDGQPTGEYLEVGGIPEVACVETPAMKELPPDPEDQNEDRAAWAEAALETFRERTGTDYETALPDLLCDLMHWADRNSGKIDGDQWPDFEHALRIAGEHYTAETTKEPE